MSTQAWVTLATNDSYSLGALVLAHSLQRAQSQHPAVVLITPSVTPLMRARLGAVFAEVVVVDVLDSQDAAHLALLQRPELGITFTKIHCWNLTQYEKCVFLDADTLVVQNCDELFEREELSAAPDVGWPDCFNSGVFVFRPSADTFAALLQFAQERGSFDGGDQGLLNAFFSGWAREDIARHLPFLYNVTSAAFYSYLPALQHYGAGLKIIHFIGNAKPWLQGFDWEARQVQAPGHLQHTLQLWWDLFVGLVHPQLDTEMGGLAGTLARLAPGAAAPQQAALDELSRRQGWEAGNIDYMGADSFANIWAKISQTLAQPKGASPPKESPPEPEAVQPAVPVTPVEQEIVASAEPAALAEQPTAVAPTASVEPPAPATLVEPPVPAVLAAPAEQPAPAEPAVPLKPLTPVTEVAVTPVASESLGTVPQVTKAPLPSTEAAAEKVIVVPEAEKAVEQKPVGVAAPKAAPVEGVAAKKDPVTGPAAAPPVQPAAPVVQETKPAVTGQKLAQSADPKTKSVQKEQAPSVPEKAKSPVTPPAPAGPPPADSPPLASTPAKDSPPPPAPDAQSTEEAAQETRL